MPSCPQAPTGPPAQVWAGGRRRIVVVVVVVALKKNSFFEAFAARGVKGWPAAAEGLLPGWVARRRDAGTLLFPRRGLAEESPAELCEPIAQGDGGAYAHIRQEGCAD